MSAMLMSGSRQLAWKILTKSAFSSPPLTIFMGGMRMPSWKISVFSMVMLPGTRPPMSM